MERTDTSDSPARSMNSLLQSIAREIVERTSAILALEIAMGDEAQEAAERDRRVATMAAHRRELRRAETELRSLGWRRDPERPLRFLRAATPGGRDLAWRPEGTAFYRSLDVSGAA